MKEVLTHHPRFMSRKMRKRELQKERKDEKVVSIVSKILVLENPGIDPGTSRMQSGRSTI